MNVRKGRGSGLMERREKENRAVVDSNPEDGPGCPTDDSRLGERWPSARCFSPTLGGAHGKDLRF